MARCRVLHFLVDEAFVFEDDGSVLGIRPDLLDDFKVLSEHNGVEVKDKRDKEPEPIVPAWEQKKKSRVKNFDLHPDIPMSERHNFDLANNQVEEVNKKERFHRNYAAIKGLEGIVKTKTVLQHLTSRKFCRDMSAGVVFPKPLTNEPELGIPSMQC